MAVDPALTTGEQNALNGGKHTIKRYLSAYIPDAIYSSTLGGSPITFPLNIINVNAIVPTTVKRGMTAIISLSGVVKGIYRVRKDGDGIAGILYLGEFAEADPGLLNIGYRTAGVAPGDAIAIYNRFDIWTQLPIYNAPWWYEDAFSYGDWVTANGSDNEHPDLIVNLGKHRSVFCDAGQTYATLSFTATLIQWPADYIVCTIAWQIPASWTVTAGSSSTATFTARVPAGMHLLPCYVTQDNGSITRAYRFVWVHNAGSTVYGSNAPIPIVEIVSDERDRTGRIIGLGLNDNALASIPDGSMVNYFEVCTWNGTDVPTATSNMTGWLTRADWRLNFGTRRADCTIVGPAELLKMVGGFSQYVASTSGVPADFQTIMSSMSHIQFVIWYMLRMRSPNVLALFDFNPWIVNGAYTPPWAEVHSALPSFTIPQGNLYEQIMSLARSGRYNYGHSSDGSAWIRKHPSEYDPATRVATFVLRDTLTTNRYTLPLNFSREMKPKTRRCRVSGFESNTGPVVPGLVINAVIGEAPNQSFGQGTDEDIINDYVSDDPAPGAGTAQTDVNNLSGQIFARDNNPYPDIPFSIPDNRDVYEPTQMPMVDTVVPAANAPDGVGWTSKKGIPLKVSKQHNINGTAHITLHLEMETAGVSGGTVTIPT